MKAHRRFSALTAILAGSVLAFGLTGPTSAQQPGPQPPHEPRPQNHGGVQRPEKQAFLGVATSPVEASMRAQLGLDPGFGLLIRHIQGDSPAANALEPHDVLIKFDDQRLVNQDQLAMLVRSAGKDAKVTLTLVRAGKEQQAEVTLTEQEFPTHAARFPGDIDHDGFAGTIPFPGLQQPQGFNAGDVERQMREMREQMERWMRDQQQRGPNFNPNQGPRPPRGADVDVRIESHSSSDQDGGSNSSSSTMRKATWVENGVVMSLSDDGKTRKLTIDQDGKRVFDGPIDTDEQLKKIPEDVRENAERLLKRLDAGPKPPAAAGAGGGEIF